MQNNPEIELIVDQAVKIARDKSHEYVTTEHVLLSMIRYAPFRKTLDRFGVDVTTMDQEVNAYLDSMKGVIKTDANLQPRKTQTLERLFNRANVQVMFTGRRTLTTLDLYLSIMAETNSHAHYFLLKYGVKKTEFSEFYSKNYHAGETKMNPVQANEILTEYCTNLTAMAQADQLEPLIGRQTELHEMISVMARRFKANVLMVGDPGVGKTCIVDGLAQEIVAGRVPKFIQNHEV